MTDTLPRLGFVGVGWIGRHRMASVLKAGCAEAAAVMDASPQAVAEARRLAPEAKAVQTMDDLLALDLDGVVVATPNAFHAEQSIRALDAGLPVFCQKPPGRNANEVASIVEAARRNDCYLSVDLSYRYLSAMQRIHELVRDGEIGEVYAMDLVFHNAYGPDKAWFYDRELSGGGCLLDLGIHMIDLALWTMDFPSVRSVTGRLFAQGRPWRAGDRAVEDYATTRLDFDNGATATVACSWRQSAGCDAIISATWHGSTGSLRMHNVNGSFYDFRAERLHGTRSRVLVEPPEDWSGRAVIGWAERLPDKPGFDPEAERHVAPLQIIDKVYEQCTY